MREFIRRLLLGKPANPPSEPCRACEVYRRQVSQLEDQLEVWRRECKEAQLLLHHVLRVPGTVTTPAERVSHEPIRTGAGKSWNMIKRELEKKHAKKPEDRTADYWTQKAAEMEAQAGLIKESNEEKRDASQVG